MKHWGLLKDTLNEEASLSLGGRVDNTFPLKDLGPDYVKNSGSFTTQTVAGFQWLAGGGSPRPKEDPSPLQDHSERARTHTSTELPRPDTARKGTPPTQPLQRLLAAFP